MKLIIDTSFYEAAHEKKPHHNAKGTWKLVPPRTLGNRHMQFVDMSYNDMVNKYLPEAIGQRPLGKGDKFILVP